jgi:hypothetical protein
MFRLNRPSSDVQVVVINVSAAHCEAASFLLCGCLGLHVHFVQLKDAKMKTDG